MLDDATTAVAVAGEPRVPVIELKTVDVYVRVGATGQAVALTQDEIDEGYDHDDNWDADRDPVHRTVHVRLNVPVDVSGEPDVTVDVGLPHGGDAASLAPAL